MRLMTLPPGFRFHPTDEELVTYYLHRKITGKVIEIDVIPDVDLYKCEPWDLPDKSFFPSMDSVWYFYSPRNRKYPNGSRTNRATRFGYWKATGKDRIVQSGKRTVGMKKTLVYYRGRAPNGIRTDWIMHEYRIAADSSSDSYALCRVFKKEHGGAPAVKMSGNSTATPEISSSNLSLGSPFTQDFNEAEYQNIGTVYGLEEMFSIPSSHDFVQ